MELPDFLDLDADGEVHFKGHRLRILDVAACFREGHSPEGIAFDIYPTLDLRLVYKAIAQTCQRGGKRRRGSPGVSGSSTLDSWHFSM